MVVICGLYDGHLQPIYLLQAIYSFSRDPHSTPVPVSLFDSFSILAQAIWIKGVQVGLRRKKTKIEICY